MTSSTTGTTLVTGATRGIGRAIVERLASHERVIGVYRSNSQAARALSQELSRVELHACDLASPAATDALITALGAQQVRFTGVVLNAGIAEHGGFVRTRQAAPHPAPEGAPPNAPEPHTGPHAAPHTAPEGAPPNAPEPHTVPHTAHTPPEQRTGAAEPAAYDPLVSQLRTNLEAPLHLLRGLLEAELIADGASVVMLSSNLVRHAVFGRVAYAAAKAGLEAAVRQLCVELGPRGVRVNAVAPGLIHTDMTAARSAAELVAYAQMTPLGRVGEAVDVARVVGFFLGGEAAYVSGQVLEVDGGWGAR